MALVELQSPDCAQAGPGTLHFAKVQSLFPRASVTISHLRSRDGAFRGLCEAYELTAEALRTLEIRNHPLDVESMHEYRRVLRELEARLLAAFRASRRRGFRSRVESLLLRA